MKFVAILLLAVAAFQASAFQAPVARNNFVGARTAFPKSETSMKMAMDIDLTSVQSVLESTNVLLASKPTDFGGLYGPIFGLSLIGGLILFLSPPLKDD
eukprot:CAMPEP_0194593588 /NCGR_PEP_ID=MMETSP0292-20121207/23612_1 /TAXON_ID=39354 /ORGANISM="Heterosigma akashiwo, Strain CCMP2393" /LENGTH=98 /DNA_ID=CAMNT_0039452605 /DNA_START=83 /DNA_END=379 /DNA_ORIENTATION=+